MNHRDMVDSRRLLVSLDLLSKLASSRQVTVSAVDMTCVTLMKLCSFGWIEDSFLFLF